MDGDVSVRKQRGIFLKTMPLEGNAVKSSNRKTTRKVNFSTQGSKTPDPLDTEGKGIVEIFDDHQGDRLGWCSSERDKHDVLYSVYGRTNVRFDP